MHKEKIERSEAILKGKRNTRKGLRMRNEILKFLYTDIEKKFTTSEIISGISSTYAKVTYHLKNMSEENVVTKFKIRRRIYWQITGLGQQTIRKWLEENSEK
ncbi:MAG: helix-turn-helix transcriptional regulator [Asgard group archaeon]|nr:helix-turn-helix transcriptional regulator [Asgard group archaeon]